MTTEALNARILCGLASLRETVLLRAKPRRRKGKAVECGIAERETEIVRVLREVME
jgi:hypothetical protein